MNLYIPKNEKVVMEYTVKYCKQTNVAASILDKCGNFYNVNGKNDDEELYDALKGNYYPVYVEYLLNKGSKITEKVCNVFVFLMK